MANLQFQSHNNEHSPVGVGLRYEHYQDALTQPSDSIDFIEIHAENFFAEGGAVPQFLEALTQQYSISIHGTSMGLGSATGVNKAYLTKFAALVDRVKPVLVSDHACFTWGNVAGKHVHAGDLLPIQFNDESLDILAGNINEVQQVLGRQILVENIVSYLDTSAQKYDEAEFLALIAEKTQCGLLVDLNNILVNGSNFHSGNLMTYSKQWLDTLPTAAVREFHLAGSSQVPENDLIIDDHSQPVSESCWELYRYAQERFRNVATLIEWDNQLPNWTRLTEEARKARDIKDSLNSEWTNG